MTPSVTQYKGRRADTYRTMGYSWSLTAESVEGTTLPLQCVDHIHGSDSLPLGVFSVGDSIPDDILQEDFQNSSGLLIDESGYALDSSSSGQPTNGWFGDALDVVPQHLAVTFGTTLSKAFSSFAASRHVVLSTSQIRLILLV